MFCKVCRGRGLHQLDCAFARKTRMLTPTRRLKSALALASLAKPQAAVIFLIGVDVVLSFCLSASRRISRMASRIVLP